MNQFELQCIADDLAFNDSHEALRSLYLHYRERIHRYVLLYVKSNEVARELVSDVFVALWENRKYIPEVSNLDAYTYRIAKFKALNYLRVKSISPVDLDGMDIDLFAHTKVTPEDQLISNETIEALNNAVSQLPAKCKIAFKLVREDGMKYKDAAQHLGISVKTLEAHLSTAVKRIRTILGARITPQAGGNEKKATGLRVFND